jgi:hypothetical protein
MTSSAAAAAACKRDHFRCDIFDDFYEMSPQQVIAFCTECMLSEDEDGECEIPDGFYDKPRP